MTARLPSAYSEVSSDIAEAIFAAEAQQMLKTRQQPLPKSLPLKSRLRPAPSAASTLPLRPPALISKLRASTVNSSLGRQSLIKNLRLPHQPTANLAKNLRLSPRPVRS